MAYYAKVILETKASATERHEDFGAAQRWIDDERHSNPELFHLGQIIEATPARPVVAACNANGWDMERDGDAIQHTDVVTVSGPQRRPPPAAGIKRRVW